MTDNKLPQMMNRPEIRQTLNAARSLAKYHEIPPSAPNFVLLNYLKRYVAVLAEAVIRLEADATTMRRELLTKTETIVAEAVDIPEDDEDDDDEYDPGEPTVTWLKTDILYDILIALEKANHVYGRAFDKVGARSDAINANQCHELGLAVIAALPVSERRGKVVSYNHWRTFQDVDTGETYENGAPVMKMAPDQVIGEPMVLLWEDQATDLIDILKRAANTYGHIMRLVNAMPISPEVIASTSSEMVNFEVECRMWADYIYRTINQIDTPGYPKSFAHLQGQTPEDK